MNLAEQKNAVVQIQEDLTYGLLSWDALDRINVVQERKLRMRASEDADVDVSSVWTTPRNGRSGCGVLVEMPTIEVAHVAGPGPQLILVVSLLVLEQPDENMSPTKGTLLDAETVARLGLRFLHGWFLASKGEIYPQRQPIQPASEDWPGLIAYRVACGMFLVDEGWQRLSTPTVSEAGLLVTLTPPGDHPDAVVYYTTDDSLPGSGTPGAVVYTEPFAVPSGTVVRFGAYKEGYLPSAIDRVVIS